MPGRFIIGVLDRVPDSPLQKPQWTLADSWIWARVQQLMRDVERLFGNHQYGEAGRQIYDFFWTEFADWYLEIAKLQINNGGDEAFYTAQTVVRVLDTCLRLLHPFTPFVTEELWGHLKAACTEKSAHFTPPNGWEEALMMAAWPQPQPLEGWEQEKVNEFMLIQDIVRAIRNVRMENNIPPGKKIPATIIAEEKTDIVSGQLQTICSLANVKFDQVNLVQALDQKPSNQTPVVISGIEVFLMLTEKIDSEAEIERLNKELAEATSQITRLKNLLNSPFAEKAPAAVVQKEREKLDGFLDTAAKLKKQLQN